MLSEQTRYEHLETGCCPKVDVNHWDGRLLEWREKPFLKDRIRSFHHRPFNLERVLHRDFALIQRASALPEEPLWLAEQTSPWRSELLLAVDRTVPGHETVLVSGVYVARVFEGSMRNAENWEWEMAAFVMGMHWPVRRLFYFNATCANRSLRQRHNQVVLIAKVD